MQGSSLCDYGPVPRHLPGMRLEAVRGLSSQYCAPGPQRRAQWAKQLDQIESVTIRMIIPILHMRLRSQLIQGPRANSGRRTLRADVRVG